MPKPISAAMSQPIWSVIGTHGGGKQLPGPPGFPCAKIPSLKINNKLNRDRLRRLNFIL
jgi:hypothetical protein